ncbi:galactose-3-O-sulfotransferase 4 isoform 2-T2 [Ciconia maguari]
MMKLPPACCRLQTLGAALGVCVTIGFTVQLLGGPFQRRAPAAPAGRPPAPCQPRTHLVFLKTHKTGGSSVVNLLHRFGEARGLRFALPHRYQFGYPSPFRAERVKGYRPGGPPFDIICHHMRFNLTEAHWASRHSPTTGLWHRPSGGPPRWPPSWRPRGASTRPGRGATTTPATCSGSTSGCRQRGTGTGRRWRRRWRGWSGPSPWCCWPSTSTSRWCCCVMPCAGPRRPWPPLPTMAAPPGTAPASRPPRPPACGPGTASTGRSTPTSTAPSGAGPRPSGPPACGRRWPVCASAAPPWPAAACGVADPCPPAPSPMAAFAPSSPPAGLRSWGTPFGLGCPPLSGSAVLASPPPSCSTRTSSTGGSLGGATHPSRPGSSKGGRQ